MLLNSVLDILIVKYTAPPGDVFELIIIIGASLSEPHINVLNASGVCMYVRMYVCMYSYVVP